MKISHYHFISWDMIVLSISGTVIQSLHSLLVVRCEIASNKIFYFLSASFDNFYKPALNVINVWKKFAEKKEDRINEASLIATLMHNKPSKSKSILQKYFLTPMMRVSLNISSNSFIS